MGAERIRAVERALDVLERLSRGGPSSLAELRRETGLPNPTLLRILGTLTDRGWVRRNIALGGFELSHGLGRVLGEAARAHPLAELAAPILIDLGGRPAGWPSDLCAVMGAGRIEIVESTRMRGPLAPTRSGLGVRPSMLLSAHGRAILAFSTEAASRAHLTRIEAGPEREERAWLASGRLDAEIAATRARGYGLREPGYWARPFDPGPEIGAMAVPILSRAGLHGTVSVMWIAGEMSLQEVLAAGSMEDLRRASLRIGAELERAGVEAPEVT